MRCDEGSEDELVEPGVVHTVRRRALGRRWRHLARERIDGDKPIIPLGKKFWALEPSERDELERLFADPEIKCRILALDGRDLDRELRMVDAAYWKKGCSSLGLLRYAVVVGLRGATGREDLALIDIKEATAPVAPIARGAVMPKDDAERVVVSARALSPYLGDRMMAGHLLGKPVFIRELAPQDLKLEVEQFTRGEAIKAARYLAFVVGKAHARQMDARQRDDWRRQLRTHRGAGLDAPSWLWEAIVNLSSAHEAAYLEHCRRYALAAAA